MLRFSKTKECSDEGLRQYLSIERSKKCDFFLIRALGLILGACFSADDTDIDSENISEQNVLEITDEIEEAEEKTL